MISTTLIKSQDEEKKLNFPRLMAHMENDIPILIILATDVDKNVLTGIVLYDIGTDYTIGEEIGNFSLTSFVEYNNHLLLKND
jgi:hypothetical protein